MTSLLATYLNAGKIRIPVLELARLCANPAASKGTIVYSLEAGRYKMWGMVPDASGVPTYYPILYKLMNAPICGFSVHEQSEVAKNPNAAIGKSRSMLIRWGPMTKPANHPAVAIENPAARVKDPVTGKETPVTPETTGDAMAKYLFIINARLVITILEDVFLRDEKRLFAGTPMATVLPASLAASTYANCINHPRHPYASKMKKPTTEAELAAGGNRIGAIAGTLVDKYSYEAFAVKIAAKRTGADAAKQSTNVNFNCYWPVADYRAAKDTKECVNIGRTANVFVQVVAEDEKFKDFTEKVLRKDSQFFTEPAKCYRVQGTVHMFSAPAVLASAQEFAPFVANITASSEIYCGIKDVARHVIEEIFYVRPHVVERRDEIDTSMFPTEECAEAQAAVDASMFGGSDANAGAI
jgi:hypothetical protein